MMRTTRWKRALIGLVCLAAAGGLVSGCATRPPPEMLVPPASASWSALADLADNQNLIVGLRPGHAVAGASGNQLVGWFQQFDRESLTVRSGWTIPGTDRAVGVTVVPRRHVSYVKVRVTVPDSTDDGTVLGLVIGAAATAVTVALLCTAENDCPPAYVGVLFVPIGATAGAFTGRSYDRRRTETRLVTIFEAGGGSPR